MFLINNIFNLFWCSVAFVNIRPSCHPYGVWIWQFGQKYVHQLACWGLYFGFLRVLLLFFHAKSSRLWSSRVVVAVPNELHHLSWSFLVCGLQTLSKAYNGSQGTVNGELSIYCLFCLHNRLPLHNWAGWYPISESELESHFDDCIFFFL